MPKISGFDIARKIRALPAPLRQIPLLAFSSSTLSRSHNFKEAGFDGFLPKPVRRKKLIKMVARLLGLKVTDEEAQKESAIITSFSIEEEAKHSVHILLAEDNPINLKLAMHILEKAGYHLTVANNGQEAVAIFMANPDQFDLIFMDVQMPVLDGKEATIEIRKKGFSDIPIIAMTAEVMKGDRERCLKIGMNDYISKPIKRSEVYQMVKKWCLEKT
jgi:CheY-like chemotaxis protein